MQKPREDVAFAHLLRLLGFFVFGFQQPQHRRLLDSHHLRGPSYCPLRCWFCFVSVASCFASNKNVGVNHQLFTFCYLFSLQSADLEFCSAEGGLSM
ncbi:hypothetical protein L3X38_039948 [Prunus dulcis]|uniref:Uncharacterized protein n=1 Tax=Prunus dulcis TaxID=3755 RepID=A0AAD4V827_PRUDU|nr:hypothetical protein L3X38_039948 [Prunus dulcis]